MPEIIVDRDTDRLSLAATRLYGTPDVRRLVFTNIETLARQPSMWLREGTLLYGAPPLEPASFLRIGPQGALRIGGGRLLV